MSNVLLPALLVPGRIRLTEAGRTFFRPVLDLHLWDWEEKRIAAGKSRVYPIRGGSGTFSNFTQTKVLAHLTGQDNASWANLSPVFLALCTSVPDSSKTGSTISEATYTGYARLSIPNTSFAAASSGGAGGQSTIATNTTLTFAACTGGSSTITGFALCDAATVGDVLAWGSATSTVVSTTQTPATVSSGGLSLGLM